MSKMISEHDVLSQWWHPSKNERLASETSLRDYGLVWWRCPQGHAFERAPRAMAKTPTCPACAIAGDSLAARHPELAVMWHPTKNEELRPQDIQSEHGDSCWWVCGQGHAFARAPREMIRDASCPQCALSADSLAARAPKVAQLWHGEKNAGLSPEQIAFDHASKAWWRCERGHEFQRSVRAMSSGDGRCPQCYGGWSLEYVKAFVQSLMGHVDALNSSEIFTLAMQAGVFDSGGAYRFALAVSGGKFPQEELEKFIRDEPSMVDEFATDPSFRLEQETYVEQELRGPDPYALPHRFNEPLSQSVVDVPLGVDISEVSEVYDEHGEKLPTIQTQEALKALNAFAANADAETVRFLSDSALAKLWRHAFEDEDEARAQAEAFRGDTYSDLVRDRFLEQLNEAQRLELPAGYAFRPTAEHEITPPSLMQRHVAVRVWRDHLFGNWSGTGAGKTLSALLSTRVVNAQLTVICCPNSVVGNWRKEIRNAFPNSQICLKTWEPDWDASTSAPRYLVLNYEAFQMPESESKLLAFLEANTVEFLIIDEIHFAKQRSAQMSQRKRLVQALRLEADRPLKAQGRQLYVLGMSATPVINELQEGRSLVELITGHVHHDLETRPTVQNCMRLYQRLVTLGTRYMPPYEMELDESERPLVDCSSYLDEIRALSARGASPLALEQVLTRARIPEIVRHVPHGKKTIVYTYFVEGIVGPLRRALEQAGHRVGTFTGDSDEHDLEEFKSPKGRVDVLIASSRISTGVDGLQHVCDTLIVNALPWTRAEYEQLRGRLWRQGSVFNKITIVVPLTYADLEGGRWSYCQSKLDRLAYKKSIADAAVDGVVPEGELRTPAQAQRDILGWLERLESGEVVLIERPQVVVPLSGERGEVERRHRSYGDFTTMNNRWYASRSSTTHERLQQNPEEWAHYHTMYRELRQSWEVVPFQEELDWLERRTGLVVGDFGCGEALIAAEAGEAHTIHSFDHVAIHDGVIACDMSEVPLGDNTLDLAIFCLSLMGTNLTAYLLEARRCLKLDGRLHIWEGAGRMKDPERFCRDLERLGFEVTSPLTKGGFIRIYTSKTERSPQPGFELTMTGD